VKSQQASNAAHNGFSEAVVCVALSITLPTKKRPTSWKLRHTVEKMHNITNESRQNNANGTCESTTAQSTSKNTVNNK
jgi:hypothetical protein